VQEEVNELLSQSQIASAPDSQDHSPYSKINNGTNNAAATSKQAPTTTSKTCNGNSNPNPQEAA
jgi:hypothetical protein